MFSVTDKLMVIVVGREPTGASSGAISFTESSDLVRFHSFREFGFTILTLVLVGRVIVVALGALHDLRLRWSGHKTER